MSELSNVLPEGTTTPSSSVTSPAGSGKVLPHPLTEILCFGTPLGSYYIHIRTHTHTHTHTHMHKHMRTHRDTSTHTHKNIKHIQRGVAW